jgi:hypothetical protein
MNDYDRFPYQSRPLPYGRRRLSRTGVYIIIWATLSLAISVTSLILLWNLVDRALT